MSPKRSDKVRQAMEQARRAHGRDVDQGDLDRDWPRAARPRRIEASRIILEPAGDSMLVLTFADVARELGVQQARVAAMVDTGQLATMKVGDHGARMVPRPEVERLLAAQDA